MSGHSDAHIVAAGAEVLREGAACLETAAGLLGADFVEVVRRVAEPDSFTMVVGVGKSGYIGRKLVASLLSTGHGAAFLNPTDDIHGDIGIAEHATLAVLLSHSGNTEELVDLVPAIKQFGVPSVAITRGRDCALAEYVDWIVETGVGAEAGIARLVPTSSSTATLALCDALTMSSLALRGFSAEQFQRYHPGGMLGRKMRKVADVMIPWERLVWVDPAAGVAEASAAISAGGLGFALVSDAADKASLAPSDVGFVSDGDIRRALGENRGGGTVGSIMTLAPKSIDGDALAIEALRLMEQHAIVVLLCASGGRVAGAVHIHGVVARELGLAPARGQAPR